MSETRRGLSSRSLLEVECGPGSPRVRRPAPTRWAGGDDPDDGLHLLRLSGPHTRPSVPPRAVRQERVLGYSGVSRGFKRYARPSGATGWEPALTGAALEADVSAQASDPRWPLQRLRFACGIAATIALHCDVFG